MANGQQLRDENISKFRNWAAQMVDDEYRELVRGGQLSRTEIAKQCSIGMSALRQNPTIKAELAAIEQDLRERALLPPLIGEAQPASTTGNKADADRVRRLESENAQLKVKVQQYENHLKKYKLLDSCLTETMRVPR